MLFVAPPVAFCGECNCTTGIDYNGNDIRAVDNVVGGRWHGHTAILITIITTISISISISICITITTTITIAITITTNIITTITITISSRCSQGCRSRSLR